MKNSKRMLAVVAASGLVLGGLPGVANAQSEELLDLNLNLNIGDSVGLGVDLGLGSLGIEEGDLGEFPNLAGSVTEAVGATGSDDLDTGSENLDEDVIGDLIEAGSANGPGSSEEPNTGSDSASDDLGSDDLGSDDLGSDNGTDGFLSAGSLTPGGGTGSDSNDEGTDDETEGEDEESSIIERITAWFEELFSGSANGGSGSGSADDDETDEPVVDEDTGFLSSLEDIFSGSLEGGSGSGSADDDETDEPVVDEDTGFLSSLEDIFSGSLEGGSGSGSAEGEGNEEEEEEDDEAPGGDTTFNSAELDADVLLAVGSLAAAGIAVGIAANGGVNLPPLPGVDVGVVCELPQEGIDFLKGNGSMQPDECLPEN